MSTNVVRNEPCPRCQKKGMDKSGDNLVIYSDGSFHCFACGYTKLSLVEREKRGLDRFIWSDNMEEEVSSKEPLTQEEMQKVRGYTNPRGNNLRGITDETYKVYQVRHKFNEETGEPSEQYYPITHDYVATGYKIRILPKTFSSVGKFGKESDLFGQWRFKNSSGRYVVLCAGEVDTLSAFQMLEDYRKSRNSDFEPIPVVSSVIGESGSHKQVAKHFDWLNRFERVIVCYDNDQAGKDALKELVKVLPKGKMFVMDLPLKDANLMLTSGKHKAFIDYFYKAQPYTPDGIISSAGVMSKIIEQALIPKIPLPHFMHKLQRMMAGGIPLGTIINLASASGTGKSTIVDELIYYWVFNSPHMIGVVTMESDIGQYGTKLLSRHVGFKIDLLETIEEKIEMLNSEKLKGQAETLWYKEDGSPRFYLIDERDGGLPSMQALIMNLIISCSCKVIVLDPMTDLIDSLTHEDQAKFMKWQKGLVKSHQVTFINISHTRKTGSDKKAGSTGADIYEEDMFGNSAVYKSAACNLLFTRNKEAEDELERNTVKMKATKIRWTGITGVAGEYYYELKSHKLWDKEEWMKTLMSDGAISLESVSNANNESYKYVFEGSSDNELDAPFEID